MVMYSKFTKGSQFLGEKKQIVNPLHGLQVAAILVIQENSGVFRSLCDLHDWVC